MKLFRKKKAELVTEPVKHIIGKRFDGQLTLNKIDGMQLIMDINGIDGMIGSKRLAFDRTFIPPEILDMKITGRILIEIQAEEV